MVTDQTKSPQSLVETTLDSKIPAEGLERMISVLTHESRNALQLASANLELLSLEVENQPEVIHCISRIKTAHQRLSRLFQELDEFALPVVLDLEEYDLSGLLRQVLEELSDLHRRRQIHFREIRDVENLCCRCDPYRMHQVFRNLLENALAACPDPVILTVHWSQAPDQDGLRLRLCDNGPGLPLEHYEKVFEPFFTTKPKGVGLGLAITQRILELHGGEITIAEPNGGGAEFVITLPR